MSWTFTHVRSHVHVLTGRVSSLLVPLSHQVASRQASWSRHLCIMLAFMTLVVTDLVNLTGHQTPQRPDPECECIEVVVLYLGRGARN